MGRDTSTDNAGRGRGRGKGRGRGRGKSSHNNNNSGKYNNNNKEMKFYPHTAGRQQTVTYDTVKDHIIQSIQKNYEQGSHLIFQK